MTAAQIREKILGRESFWVGTHSERVTCVRTAKTLAIKYTTGPDERGGFYIVNVPKVKKGK